MNAASSALLVIDGHTIQGTWDPNSAGCMYIPAGSVNTIPIVESTAAIIDGYPHVVTAAFADALRDTIFVRSCD